MKIFHTVVAVIFIEMVKAIFAVIIFKKFNYLKIIIKKFFRKKIFYRNLNINVVYRTLK